jgi:hypothetical protein
MNLKDSQQDSLDGRLARRKADTYTGQKIAYIHTSLGVRTFDPSVRQTPFLSATAGGFI